MGLFDKKYCDVCGEKIGLLGNRKLEDGNLCKNCAANLSPWFSDRRHSTLEDIKGQLQSREANKQAVASFQKTTKLGKGAESIYVDETKGLFAVCYEKDWNGGNPDILSFSNVLSCEVDEDEHRTELKQRDSEGKMVSYNPPRYEYTYDFYCKLTLEHPYIDEIRFRLNDVTLKKSEGFGGLSGMAFEEKLRSYYELGDEIKRFFKEHKSSGGAGTSIGGASANSNEFVLERFAIMEKDPMFGANANIFKVVGNFTYSVLDEETFQRRVQNVEEIQKDIEFKMMEAAKELNEKNQMLGKDIYTQQSVFTQKVKDMLEFSSARGYRIDTLFIRLQMTPEEEQRMMDEYARRDQARATAVAMNTANMNENPGVASMQSATPAQWQCPTCGTVNEGKFCINCGFKKPE